MMMKKKSAARYYEERRNLPVWVQKEEFLRTFMENQMVMVTGETGSGKTTQIPQFVLETVMDENYPSSDDQWLVGCTQPHRVAAISAARRVAEEMDVKIGEEVGYTVRFEDCSSSRTVLKYLTNDVLLREARADPLLARYKVIILDEVHDRSLATDLLVGILKRTLTSRPDFKLVVMSATLEEYFSGAPLIKEYFSGAPLIKVPSSLHPVEIWYTREPVMDYLESAISKVIQIHMCEPTGDILVFLTGEEEIEQACSRIIRSLGDQVTVVPLYSSLPSAVQHKIFDPTPKSLRKIIVSTNVAETSLSMDGIVYVVDSGFSKQKDYDFHTAVEFWLVSPISQASAYQRAGRAGRTRPGKCFRLYTEQTFNDFPVRETPEIVRSNPVNTVLTLKQLGVNDLKSFEYIDPPSPKMLLRALEDLFHLGAVDDQGNLTNIGLMMSLEEPL
ncbi:putative pre-mRNA-splicing factor ATP-dependent RNA helicase [Raphanus sativus]|uniref:RNA helicase n=1 Tax=Raphanus sativus TaxID=3726 RepID=A0A6J0P0I9_RAPSA|nr:probable pre-mRNA-splicing factor ATP-dependent RNA helicase DEAH2 [Raphanus sativus]KAJ4898381.1 putative pre-mRNA-splicing factor ATP-dependent RNA helicase [Raphanus sativus]